MVLTVISAGENELSLEEDVGEDDGFSAGVVFGILSFFLYKKTICIKI